MTIPSWVEDGRLMTESAAICERIAEGTPLEVRRDEGDYWAWRNWLHRSDATLTFPLAIMIRYTRVEPEERRLAQAVEDYKAFFGGRAKSIEAADRKSAGLGKSVVGSVDPGGWRLIKKKKQ